VLLVRGGPPGGLAQSVDRAGRPIGAPVRLPAGTTLLREVDGGLLLQSTFDATAEAAPATAEVWDPAAPDAGYDVYRTATGHLVAAGTAAMAWANPGCTAAACSLYITQTALRRGFDTILLPVGALPDTGSFSPDGRLLALRLTLPAAPGRPAATSVAVVDRARGALAVLPGTTVAGAPTSPEPRWIDAHRLALVGGSQLGVWTPTGWDRPDANPGPVAVRPLKRP
jgi:hypothetical protein